MVAFLSFYGHAPVVLLLDSQHSVGVRSICTVRACVCGMYIYVCIKNALKPALFEASAYL